LTYFIRGLVIGFSIAAPVGPIGILCIQRTLAYGRMMGFTSGLGAATADALYGLMAGLGLTIISNLLIHGQSWLSLVGGAFLIYLGVRAILTNTKGASITSTTNNLVKAFGSTFLLTLTNPLTLLSFAAIFAGLGLATSSGNYRDAVLIVMGVFSGSTLWWFILSGLASLFRDKLTPESMRWINIVAGLIILGIGIFVLINLIR
jgi:threonine/homoserine/homoserine lactone efflux protein